MFTGKLISGVLRDERKKSGYTQQQIADLLGIDRSTYTYYESGKLQAPQEVLVKLSEYYHMPVSMFFSESSDSIVFHSDLSFHGYSSPQTSGTEKKHSRSEAGSLTFEEKRLIAQLRAKSSYTDEKSIIPTFSPMESDDDAFLSYLVDPDDE